MFFFRENYWRVVGGFVYNGIGVCKVETNTTLLPEPLAVGNHICARQRTYFIVHFLYVGGKLFPARLILLGGTKGERDACGQRAAFSLMFNPPSSRNPFRLCTPLDLVTSHAQTCENLFNTGGWIIEGAKKLLLFKEVLDRVVIGRKYAISENSRLKEKRKINACCLVRT